MKYTKKQIKILEELLRRLDKKCSDSWRTCPKSIDSALFPNNYQCNKICKDCTNPQCNWACEDCDNMFSFVFGDNFNELSYIAHCPCTHPKTRQIATATVEEIIDDYYRNYKEKRKDKQNKSKERKVA